MENELILGISGRNYFNLEFEYEQLKQFADFLFFDQQSEKLQFPRFEECLGLLASSQNFPIKKIYMEICGEGKKYITFPRLIIAFNEYKTSSKKRTKEFMEFFSYLFNSVIIVQINFNLELWKKNRKRDA